jgi:ankyrin repeat protein
LDVRDNLGTPGFHYACRNGHLNVVHFLVQKGCDWNVRDNRGYTGFHSACRNGHLNVVQFLVQKGCDWNIRNNFGNTGFHLACDNGNLNVVQFLVQHGFEGINEPNFHGTTGLQSLIEQRYEPFFFNNEHFMSCLLLLIESGAQMKKNDVFRDLISAIQNRIIEITFMKETIFEKWTGRIAQAITNYAIHPFTNASLQNLSQILDDNA